MNNKEIVYDEVVEVVEKSFKTYYRKAYVGSRTMMDREVIFYAKVKCQNYNIIECSISEKIYNRLVEGMKINANIRRTDADDKVIYSIEEMELIYDSTTNEVVNNYVNREMDRLATFSKNNGLREEKGKSNNGILILISLFFLAVGIITYIIKYTEETYSDTRDLQGPLVLINLSTFALFIAIMYNTYRLRYSVVAKKFYIIFSIIVCDVITLLNNIFTQEKYYNLNIIITAVLFCVAVFLFRKGIKYTRTRTKFRFEVVKVFENNGRNRVVLSKLSDTAEPTGYPYLVYDTDDAQKFRRFKYMNLDVKNITSLNINIDNPEYWYYDISYIDNNAFEGKELGAVTNFVYLNR